MSIFEQDLAPQPVNHIPLTPLSFIKRTASVYPDYPSIIHGQQRFTWAQTYARCRQLASALAQHGVRKGDTVAFMLPNIPAMVEAHFGVAMIGAVLNSLNVRLDGETIAYMLRHSETKVLVADREYRDVVLEAMERLTHKPLLIEVDDPEYNGTEPLSDVKYEDFIAQGDPDFNWLWPEDEWEAISLNYTSGTTGDPKGVVYHHRGAFLNAMGNQATWSMGLHPVYLWTLPMFHTNGWCFPWTVTAQAGVHVCLRRVDPVRIMELIREHKVTHLCGAPVVLNGLINLPEDQRRSLDHLVEAMTAGAPPPAKVIGAIEEMGVRLTHVYGLTETYGPGVACAWREAWDNLPAEERATKKARQGVPYITMDDMYVGDPETMEPVPKDGTTVGEIFLRGNTVMKGYLKSPQATEEAFRGGWFHTGDLAVWHADGYVEIRDRLKDIIISGGENISTIEVENVLFRHPAVLEAAVVAQPDERWGESPCAFVTLKPKANATEQEIMQFCREYLAGFKIPKRVVFGELPKTSTGKVQKFVLRQWAKEAAHPIKHRA